METCLLILHAAVLDALFGDPSFPTHPVIWMGRLISWLEKAIFPRCRGKRAKFLGGGLLVAVTCLTCFFLPFFALRLLNRLSPWLSYAFSLYLGFLLLAGKSLKTEAMGVYHALRDGTLSDGRRAVSRIVGRDTEALTQEGVIKAAVETVAENTNDGIIAPLFYLFLGGAPLLSLYKGINTMDSMIGYKNERYLYFGRSAARLDDLVNFLPARLCGLLMILAAGLCHLDMAGAARTFLRDRYSHASPNSAQTESAMAGALGVQLAGNASYFGKLVEKPTIGDAKRKIELEDIRRAVSVMAVTQGLACLLFAGLALLRSL